MTAIVQRLLSTREAAEYLGISIRTLWTLTQRGELTCVRFGRVVRYEMADLVSYVHSCKV
jgi:excisionase family DNA binding protein